MGANSPFPDHWSPRALLPKPPLPPHHQTKNVVITNSLLLRVSASTAADYGNLIYEWIYPVLVPKLARVWARSVDWVADLKDSLHPEV